MSLFASYHVLCQRYILLVVVDWYSTDHQSQIEWEDIMGKIKWFETVLKAVSALAASGLSFIKFVGLIGKVMA